MSFYDYCMKSNELNQVEKLRYKKFVLNEALFYMIKEYEFWMKERSVQVLFKSKEYKLNVYNPDTQKPRPESYAEDMKTAQNCENEKERGKLYKNIAAGNNYFSNKFKLCVFS